MAQKDVEKQGQEEEENCMVVGGVRTKQRRCGRCGNTSDNARTCEIDVYISTEEDSK